MTLAPIGIALMGCGVMVLFATLLMWVVEGCIDD